MKNIIAALLLFGLSACCGCPPTSSNSSTMAAHKTTTSCQTASVSGMTCEACAATVSENLKKIPGVEDVAVNVSTGTVKIYTDGQKLDTASIKHIIERSGYTFKSLENSCSQ